jgi:glycerol-3-phosphate acyltransferase PlsX
MDVGINPDCRPDVLSQYAILGKLYSRFVFGVDNPRVGLLNIGSEEEKGNLLAKASFELMKESNDYNFVGNIEGYEMFSHKKADVIVCDGFVGNVALKMSEGFYNLIRERGINDEYFNKFNFEHYGGTPVLGVNGVVIIGHGASSAKAIQSMIMNTGQVIKSGLIDRIKEAFN